MVAPKPRPSLTTRTKMLDARFGDGLFYWATLFFASLILFLVLWLGLQLVVAALPAIKQFGPRFLTRSKWDPVEEIYGAWPYIYGTLMSSFLALLLAVPVGVGTAIFLAEIAPKWIRTPLSFMVELLAAVPSVVYGLWGRLVLIPAIIPLQAILSEYAIKGKEFHFLWLFKMKTPIDIPFFDGAPIGQSMMAGGLILAIMVLPFITAVSREVIKAVPPTQREAAFGLGATHWEAISGPILRTARSGIIGAIILGLARALGETMAITMVIGNGNDANISLLAPANTLSSKLALEFAEASGGQQSALMYLALTLFSITIVVNAIARLLIWNMARGIQGSTRG
ncbi:phosphate ABC transporter membrane protein 1, PhoT family [Abditibacterium utsteinense]|uniref:Phosphate transport system permease protein n=1 Tax=Abditibacterium utsteinense TaxID=1960156 RepID=A0A2S8SRM1_9BACT|nr:phosphate ABC transporter permease subunit PstC [Abditibacterium utsteinense]PQV63437.1 phosphate ABC transporter membrane protein 1, PhoT family [Abditibacterium utsteinense]